MENGIKNTSTVPEITIVTGTLNRPQIVLQLITQLVEYSKNKSIEVIVVDQSISENYQLLQKQFPHLEKFHLVHFDIPNTCKYLNYGWTHARAPIVLYLDDDVTITDKTISAHLDAYNNKQILGVAGRVINDGETVTQDNNVGKVLWYGAEFKKNFTYEKGTYVDFPYGCNMSFRKETLVAIDGFDEKLSPPIYAYNEVDLGYRISKKWKKSLLFSPDALVYHHQYKRGGTRNDFELNQVAQSNNFNYGYFLGKNFTLLENLICLVRRFPFQIIKEPRAIPAILSGFISSRATRGVSNRRKEG